MKKPKKWQAETQKNVHFKYVAGIADFSNPRRIGRPSDDIRARQAACWSQGEVAYGASLFDWFADEARRLNWRCDSNILPKTSAY